MAADVAALLDHLEVDRATIGGLSMGGYVTLALFRASPQRFSGMILADTKLQADTPEGREARRKMIELVRARGASAVAAEMLPKLLGATTARTRPDVASTVRAMIEGASVQAIEAAIDAVMGRPDSTADLPRIPCPTLVLAGDEDVITPPADAQSMQGQIGRSRLVIIPQAGHLSNLEAPDAFSQALTDFLTSNI